MGWFGRFGGIGGEWWWVVVGQRLGGEKDEGEQVVVVW